MEVNESKIRILTIKIFLLTILTIGCFYLIIKNFLYYFEYNVSTNINSIYEIPLVFPAVSVCSYTSNLIDKKSIIKCQFNQQNCSVTDFYSFYDQFLGHECYTFNRNQTEYSRKAGKLYAFQLHLFQVDTYFNGIRIYIHNGSITNPSSIDEGILSFFIFITNLLLL